MGYSTTPIHGKTARVEATTDVVMDFTQSWDLNANMDLADISKQGVAYKEKLPGQYDHTSSINCHCVMGDTGQKALHDAMLLGTKITAMKWLPNGSTEGWDSSGGYIASMSINAGLGDKVGINFNYQGSGTLAISDSQ